MHYHHISDIDNVFDDIFFNALRVSSLDNLLITPYNTKCYQKVEIYKSTWQ